MNNENKAESTLHLHFHTDYIPIENSEHPTSFTDLENKIIVTIDDEDYLVEAATFLLKSFNPWTKEPWRSFEVRYPNVGRQDK
jgi:hypothetical protein